MFAREGLPARILYANRDTERERERERERARERERERERGREKEGCRDKWR